VRTGVLLYLVSRAYTMQYYSNTTGPVSIRETR
jgi:hypothetical protein